MDDETRERAVRDASAILRLHVADDMGFCAGCRQAWSRLIPHDACAHLGYARRVMDAVRPAPTDWTLPDKLWPLAA